MTLGTVSPSGKTRPQLVRFDAESNSIRVGKHGPMTTGDEVMTWGGGVAPFDASGSYAGTCSAQGEVFAAGLKPRDETWIE